MVVVSRDVVPKKLVMYKFKKVVAISGTDEEQEISLQIDQNLFTHPVYVLFAHIFLDN